MRLAGRAAEIGVGGARFPEDGTGKFYKRIFVGGGRGDSNIPGPFGSSRSFQAGFFFLFLIYNYNIYEYINVYCMGRGWPTCKEGQLKGMNPSGIRLSTPHPQVMGP